MANTYAANFGDVMKHAILGEVIAHQQPRRYLESHGGRLEYPLASLEPGPGGVWDFLDLADGSDVLADSVYAQQLAATAGTRSAPGRYPGSIALADAGLPDGAEVVAFELVGSSADDLAEGLAARGRPATVTVADGLAGVCDLARPDDLVLLDPFDVHERGARYSAAEAFSVLAACGVPTLLWYAIYDPDDAGTWISALAGGPESGWRCRLIGRTAEGGLAGCGFVTCHLGAAATEAAAAIVTALAAVLAPVRPGLRLD